MWLARSAPSRLILGPTFPYRCTYHSWSGIAHIIIARDLASGTRSDLLLLSVTTHCTPHDSQDQQQATSRIGNHLLKPRGETSYLGELPRQHRTVFPRIRLTTTIPQSNNRLNTPRATDKMSSPRRRIETDVSLQCHQSLWMITVQQAHTSVFCLGHEVTAPRVTPYL